MRWSDYLISYEMPLESSSQLTEHAKDVISSV